MLTIRAARRLALLAVITALPTAAARAQAHADERYVIEYYYKAKWGHAAEFLELFRRNHLPLLLGRVSRGTITEVAIATPRYHATEDGRWDYRVTIVYPNVTAAHLPSAATDPDRRRLFPDSVAYDREERRRFEILDAHWDLPVVAVPLKP